jgi:hypothetical protein
MRRTLSVAVAVAVAVVALQALLVPLFAGPAARLAPRDLPIAVAGPPAAASGVANGLAAAHPGAFDVRRVADAAAADAAIRDRQVYGAIVLTPAGPSLHVASAAGPAVSTLLTQAAAGLGASAVRDVVPTDPDDPRGTGFAAGFLPLAVTALLAGVLVFLLVPRRSARLGTLVLFAALAGLADAAVLQAWLGILPGDHLAIAGVTALFAVAVAATVAGLGALLDRPGLALGVLVIFLVGNALGAVAAAPELLPQPWGAVGQALPIGAGATLLRSVAYFHGHGAGTPLLVLAAYAIGGLLLVAAGRRGTRRTTTAAAHAEPAEAALQAA